MTKEEKAGKAGYEAFLASLGGIDALQGFEGSGLVPDWSEMSDFLKDGWIEEAAREAKQ